MAKRIRRGKSVKCGDHIYFPRVGRFLIVYL